MSGYVRTRRWAFLALALGCTYAIYSKVPRVYFYGDDFASLLQIEDQGILQFVARPVGSHINFVRQAIFAGMFRIFGFHPEPHGWFTLGIHLLNVTLAFQIIRRMVGAPELAAFGAILWGSSPFHGNALSWYSDGQAVALTFLLIAVERVLARERAFTGFSAKSAALYSSSIVAGAASFGTGVSCALASPVALPLLLKHPKGQRCLLAAVALVPVVVVAIYFGSRRLYAAYFHEAPTLQQQVMLTFALADLRPAISAFGYFFAFGISGLLQGVAARANFTHVVSGLVWGYAGLMSVAFVRSSALLRRRMVGLLLLSCAIYGLVAVARANISLMGGIEPKSLAADPRYQYAASLPLAVLTTLALKNAFEIGRSVWFQRFALVSLLALLAYSYPERASTLDLHEGCRDYVTGVLRDLERRIDGAPVGSTLYVPNEPPPGWCSGFGLTYPGLPGSAAFFVITHPTNTVRGRRIFFVEPTEPEGWAGQFTHPKYKRLSVLLVPHFEAR